MFHTVDTLMTELRRFHDQNESGSYLLSRGDAELLLNEITRLRSLIRTYNIDAPEGVVMSLNTARKLGIKVDG